MKNFLIVHGPNLNLLGKRETNVYGEASFGDLNQILEREAKALKCRIDIVQSNHEGQIVEFLQKADGEYDGVVLNPAAYTHTSVAIRDAVSAISIPVIEVHLSNIYGREEFRQKSLIAPVAFGQVCGFGAKSYVLALRGLAQPES